MPESFWHQVFDDIFLHPFGSLENKGEPGPVNPGTKSRELHYLYSPVLTREQWQSQESRSLLDRVFGGRVAPLLAHFSTHEKLSKRDIAELRKLIDDIERKER